MSAAKSNLSGPVTLNLFQGPSGRKRGAIRKDTRPTGRLAMARSVSAETWTLKQVQGDLVGEGLLRLKPMGRCAWRT